MCQRHGPAQQGSKSRKPRSLRASASFDFLGSCLHFTTNIITRLAFSHFVSFGFSKSTSPSDSKSTPADGCAIPRKRADVTKIGKRSGLDPILDATRVALSFSVDSEKFTSSCARDMSLLSALSLTASPATSGVPCRTLAQSWVPKVSSARPGCISGHIRRSR